MPEPFCTIELILLVKSYGNKFDNNGNKFDKCLQVNSINYKTTDFLIRREIVKSYNVRSKVQKLYVVNCTTEIYAPKLVTYRFAITI